LQGQDPYGVVVSGSLEIRTGPLIGVQTYVDARTTFRNLEEAVFTLNFDSKESKRSRGLWYSLPVHGFVGTQRIQRLKGSSFKRFLELSRGDFDELAFLGAILNPSIVLMGQ
jgi:hypothetical protein